MTEEANAIEAPALSSTTRTIVMTGGAVILTPTVGATTRRPRNTSTGTTRIAPTSSTGTFTSRPADSPARSPLGLDTALVAAEAVVDTKAVAAFRAMTAPKDVDAATVMTTMVAVAKVITTEMKAHTTGAPLKDLIIKVTGAAAITTRARLPYNPDDKVT